LREQLIADMGEMTHDPSAFCRYTYPWGEGDLADSPGQRPWQEKIDAIIHNHLENPETRHQPCCIAVSSGHGIGKSAKVAMLIDWAKSTCENCKVVVTAGTGTQLKTKTVPEVAKWFRMSINADWWEMQAESIKFKAAEFQKTWRTDFITWSKDNSEAFAGLHNKGKRIILIFDEASAIDDIIWTVAEGAMTDEDTEIIWIAFGNPTRNTGRFKECFGRLKHRWHTLQIDSRTVEGTNKAQIAKWEEDYGEDSDFFRVRVKGEFPRAGSSQFISGDDVAAARKYRAVGFESLPKILSIDVARFGDDQTIMGDRQGRKLRILKKLRGLSTVQVAERAIELIEQAKREQKPYDGWVVDGDGLGAGVVDQMTSRGYGPRTDGKPGLFEFHGGATPKDPSKYFNRRAEVWGDGRDWLAQGQCEIPDDPELDTDLTSVEYGFSNKGQIQLEKKEDMKARGLSSPDCGDMFAMTFAVQILRKPQTISRPARPGRAWS
jgi:hypothetical protein